MDKKVAIIIAGAVISIMGVKYFFFDSNEEVKVIKKEPVKVEEKLPEQKPLEVPEDKTAKIEECKRIIKAYESAKWKEEALGQVFRKMNPTETACLRLIKS